MTSQQFIQLYRIHTVSRMMGISKKTLYRWEEQGLIPKIQRDWRRWRLYTEDDLTAIRRVMHEKT